MKSEGDASYFINDREEVPNEHGYEVILRWFKKIGRAFSSL